MCVQICISKGVAVSSEAEQLTAVTLEIHF
jgi:hypothetical protein